MKIIRTVTEERVTEGDVSAVPKWEVGDKVKVYSGQFEGFTFWIKDVRYRDEHRWGNGPHFEYLCGTHFQGGWIAESNLVEVDDRRGWHYDRAGYCDNPGRGY